MTDIDIQLAVALITSSGVVAAVLIFLAGSEAKRVWDRIKNVLTMIPAAFFSVAAISAFHGLLHGNPKTVKDVGLKWGYNGMIALSALVTLYGLVAFGDLFLYSTGRQIKVERREWSPEQPPRN